MKLDNLSWDTLRAYLLYDRKYSDKRSSIYAVSSRYNKLKGWFGEKEFNRSNFCLFIQYLKEKNYSTSYINNFVTLAKNVDKFLKTDCLQDYTYFKENRVWTGDVLTPKEIENIANTHIAYGKYSDYLNRRNGIIFLLLGTTGCRIGEALSLRCEDVKGDPPYVIFRDTKNNSDRMVPIGNELYKQIKELSSTKGYVFKSARNGKPLLSPEVNKDLKKRAALCGVKKRVYCHLFRHSYITTMLDNGVGVLDTGYIVGHRDPKTTARYRHSALGYYSEIARTHPLLKNEITWKSLTNKIRKQVDLYVDSGKYQIAFSDNEKKFTLIVKRTQHSC